jgi:hypothetical protein
MDYLFTLFTLFTIFTSYDKVLELEMQNKNKCTRINKKISLLFIDFLRSFSYFLLVN